MLSAGYSVGTATQQLVGWGLIGVSAVGGIVRSTVGYVVTRTKPGSSGKSKDTITRAAGDKSTSDVSDDTSPKISTTVDIEEQHNVQFAQ